MNGRISLGIKFSHSAFVLAAALSLTACLPDSESVRERRLQDFSAGEASSLATALSSYSTQSHWTLMRNAAFLNGTLAQGEAGRSPDGVLANGYCFEGSGDTANHMLLAWYTQADRDGQFTVKGIGTGAGASIVQALSQHVAPQMTGYYGNNAVQLRGPRRNGETSLALPAGCDLGIPNGAPVVVVEHIAPVDQTGIGGGSYEYRTLPCEVSGDIGARTERRAITTRDDGTVVRGAWEAHDTTCGGAVGSRAVSIERSIGNLVGALDLAGAGELQGALSGLAGLDCVKVRRGDDPHDPDNEMIDTCDTRNVDVTAYKADKDMERTDALLVREELAVACGAGNTGSYPKGQHSANFKGYTGALDVGPWFGEAVFERFTYAAEQQGGGQSSVDGQQIDYWRGHELECNRVEHLRIDCFDVFPEYRSLEPVALGGMMARRENRISGWAVKHPPAPNSPLADNAGWYDAGASCEWKETSTYGCCAHLGDDWELSGTGRKERDIAAVAIKYASLGTWRDISPAQCRQPYIHTWQECRQECTGSGEEESCTEVCETKTETRYNYASVSLDACEGRPDPHSSDDTQDSGSCYFTELDCRDIYTTPCKTVGNVGVTGLRHGYKELWQSCVNKRYKRCNEAGVWVSGMKELTYAGPPFERLGTKLGCSVPDLDGWRFCMTVEGRKTPECFPGWPTSGTYSDGSPIIYLGNDCSANPSAEGCCTPSWAVTGTGACENSRQLITESDGCGNIRSRTESCSPESGDPDPSPPPAS